MRIKNITVRRRIVDLVRELALEVPASPIQGEAVVSV
jgi:hypothetical protein